jgi:ubiquinone/menaquinone biosynthesis C-methylase UbiE
MDAESYQAIASGPFAPLYPFYAGQIVGKTGITSGRCLDAGCGGGYLGLALAQITQLDICLFDRSAEMLAIANGNIRAQRMGARVQALQGVVQAIPLADNSVDLAVSRGSLPFWERLPTAFLELERVLKPGGYAYLGGGLGTPEMRAAIVREMRSRDPHWQAGRHSHIPKHPESHYLDALQAAGIACSRVDRRETGTWVEFRKPNLLEYVSERTSP